MYERRAKGRNKFDAMIHVNTSSTWKDRTEVNASLSLHNKPPLSLLLPFCHSALAAGATSQPVDLTLFHLRLSENRIPHSPVIMSFNDNAREEKEKKEKRQK